MKRIITWGASNSRKSINRTLAAYAAGKIEGVEIVDIDLNDYELPIYGVDLEKAQGIPEAALQLREVLDTADGLVLSLAEHNGSYTAAFKNAIDWLSRLDTKVWKGKPMLLMATSPGARGGATVLQAAKTYFPFQGANIVADFSLPAFYSNFVGDTLISAELDADLNEKIGLFSEAILEPEVLV